jgi:hypothetical protein
MQWFLELLEELGSNAESVIPRKSTEQKHANKSMIGGMRACC